MSKQVQEPSAKPDRGSGQAGPGVRLRRLTVTNYRALDHFEMEFAPPRFSDEPDVFVFGSSNGLGKTSLLEACALLYLGSVLQPGRELDWQSVFNETGVPMDFVDLVVRAGHDEARVQGEFEIGESVASVDVSVYRQAQRIFSRGDRWPLSPSPGKAPVRDPQQVASRFLLMLAGATSDPFVCPPLMYFHSYRRIAEGRVETGKMIGSGNGRPPKLPAVDAFKAALVQAMMGQKGLLEGIETAQADETMGTLCSLMSEYAGVTIDKLRVSPDNSIELRVSEGGGKSFPLDGLSSGQKEIISTLFLIWMHTHSAPGIVLIDEPELHLNAEWQVGIVRRLADLVPGNQLILATHSEDVFASVEADHRFMLRSTGGATHGKG